MQLNNSLKVMPAFFSYLTNRKSFRNCEKYFLSHLKTFHISLFSSSFPCRELQEKLIEDIFWCLWRHNVSKQEFENTCCWMSFLISNLSLEIKTWWTDSILQKGSQKIYFIFFSIEPMDTINKNKRGLELVISFSLWFKCVQNSVLTDLPPDYFWYYSSKGFGVI